MNTSVTDNLYPDLGAVAAFNDNAEEALVHHFGQALKLKKQQERVLSSTKDIMRQIVDHVGRVDALRKIQNPAEWNFILLYTDPQSETHLNKSASYRVAFKEEIKKLGWTVANVNTRSNRLYRKPYIKLNIDVILKQQEAAQAKIGGAALAPCTSEELKFITFYCKKNTIFYKNGVQAYRLAFPEADKKVSYAVLKTRSQDLRKKPHVSFQIEHLLGEEITDDG